MSAAERVGTLKREADALKRDAERGALRNALRTVMSAVADIEGRENCVNPRGVTLQLWAEGSGTIHSERLVADGTDLDLVIFYSLDDLVAWVLASPAERAAIEAAECAARPEREARDFAKLDAFMASQTGRIA